MYKWKINYWMKNGDHFVGMYEGPENESKDVAEKLLNGPDDKFIGSYGVDKKHNLLVRIGDISVVDISVWPDDTVKKGDNNESVSE